MGELIKNNLGNFLAVLLIFLILVSWMFSGWPQIWPEPPVPPEIKEAQAAIAVSGSPSSNFGSSNQLTVSHTIPSGGSDYILIVGVAINGATAISGNITYNGTDMTQLQRVTQGGGIKTANEMWYLKNPTADGVAYDIVVDFAVSVGAIAGGVAFTGVDQSSTFDTVATNGGRSTSGSVSVLTDSIDDIVIATGSLDTGGDITNDNANQYILTLSGTHAGAAETAAGTGSAVSMTQTYSVSKDWTMIGVAMNIATLEESGNQAPEITNVSLNSGSDIILNEGTWKSVTTTVAITDADYCDDLSSVTATLYRASTSTPGTTCVPEDGDCYRAEIACTATTTGDTCGASDTTVEYDCGFHIWYIASPTDAGTYAGQIWAVSATTTDSASNTGTATNTQEIIEVISLNALDVTSSINYGTVVAGDNTGSVNQATTVTNTGNTAIDTQVDAEGTDMCKDDFPTCAGDKFVVTSQEFSLTSGFIWSTGIDLTDAVQELETNIAKPTSTSTDQTDIIYWAIGIPNATVIGSYTGQTNINAKIDD